MIETGDLDRGAGSETTADMATPYRRGSRRAVPASRAGFVLLVDAGNGVGGPVAHRRSGKAHVSRGMSFRDGWHFPNPIHPDPPSRARGQCSNERLIARYSNPKPTLVFCLPMATPTALAPSTSAAPSSGATS